MFTLAQFIAVFAEFTSTATTANVAAVQAFMSEQIDPVKFGGLTSQSYMNALMLLTAHWMKMSNRNGDGALTSRGVGELSAAFDVGEIERSLQLTTYGMRYLSMLRRKVGGGNFAGQSAPIGLSPGYMGDRFW